MPRKICSLSDSARQTGADLVEEVLQAIILSVTLQSLVCAVTPLVMLASAAVATMTVTALKCQLMSASPGQAGAVHYLRDGSGCSPRSQLSDTHLPGDGMGAHTNGPIAPHAQQPAAKYCEPFRSFNADQAQHTFLLAVFSLLACHMMATWARKEGRKNSDSEHVKHIPMRQYYHMVQEADGNFFESFTALSWRQENRRLRASSEDLALSPLRHGFDSQCGNHCKKQEERVERDKNPPGLGPVRAHNPPGHTPTL
ncbi:Protein kinase C conserved region 2 (CalB) [Branchiostoma belcheri]|nr:Protein kinase C conserved region 2 (CalB) [Branchiostoma belcheri]